MNDDANIFFALSILTGAFIVIAPIMFLVWLWDVLITNPFWKQPVYDLSRYERHYLFLPSALEKHPPPHPLKNVGKEYRPVNGFYWPDERGA